MNDGDANNFDVVVVGLNVVDVLAEVPPGAQRDAKHRVGKLILIGGGPAGNAACGLASLGRRVGFVARIGDDTLGVVARHELVSRGVSDALFIHDQDHRPAVAVVEVDAATGDRTVFYTLDGYKPLTAGDVNDIDLARTRLVLVDGYEAVAAKAVLQRAKAANVPSVLDLEDGETQTLHELLAVGTHAVLPAAAAGRLTHATDPAAMVAGLRKITNATLVVTDGVKGSWGVEAGDDAAHVVHRPAFKIANVVDTTGCGDAYHAAYASAVLDGLPLAGRMEFAALFASKVAGEFGGRTNLPTHASLAATLPAGASDALRQYVGRAAKTARPETVNA